MNKLVRMANNAEFAGRDISKQLHSTSYSSTVRLEIVIDDPQAVYSSGDIIDGEVVVDLKKEIDLTEILLKYRVEENTSLTIPESYGDKNRKNQRKDKEWIVRSTARLYNREVKLFPPPELRDNPRGYTLPPGLHTYPFSVRIPGHPKDKFKVLPPSLTDPQGRGSVTHMLKAVVRRTSSFKANSRIEHTLEFTPKGDYRAIDRIQIRSLKTTAELSLGSGGLFKSGRSLPVHLIAQVPDAVCQAPYEIPLQLQVAVGGSSGPQGPQIAVTSIVVDLVAYTKFQAETYEDTGVNVVNLINRQKLWQVGSKVDLTSLVNELSIGQYVTPTFTTQYITRSWALAINVTVTNPSQPSRPVGLTVKEWVRVLPLKLYDPAVLQQAEVEAPTTAAPDRQETPPAMPKRKPVNSYPREKSQYIPPPKNDDEPPPYKLE